MFGQEDQTLRIPSRKFFLIASSITLFLLAACAPGKPGSIVLGLGTTKDNCGTTICCTNCPLIEVVRVIDGDTFVGSGNQRVRLFRVDTPERGEKCFGEATDRLEELASDQVRVELGPRGQDTYGRNLFYVYTEDGRSIDELLVREGLAEAWRRDGQWRDLLVEAEHEAQGQDMGRLW